MLARGRRAQQIRAEGLRIGGLVQFSTPVHVVDDPSQLLEADTLIVATKAIDTAASLAPLSRARIGKALSVQNGVMKNDLLAAAFGWDRVLGALANMSGEVLPSGEVLFTRNVNVLIGDLAGGVTNSTQKIAQTIDSSGVRATAVPDISSQEWSKFAGWVGLLGVSITARSVTWKFLHDRGGATVLVRLVREVHTLARACGVALTDHSMFPVASLSRGSEEAAVEVMQGLAGSSRDGAPQHKLSTLQDIEGGRAPRGGGDPGICGSAGSGGGGGVAAG